MVNNISDVARCCPSGEELIQSIAPANPRIIGYRRIVNNNIFDPIFVGKTFDHNEVTVGRRNRRAINDRQISTNISKDFQSP